MPFNIGVARTRLTPTWGVELAGWGYYLGRVWQRIRDHTAATALVIDDGTTSAALIAVDLMYADADFTAAVRRHVATHTTIRPEAVCVGCSHSHNTPTAALIRGAGEVDADYVVWAARQAATAAILAWKQRRSARLRVGKADVAGLAYNRTRPNGPVDTQLSVWRADHLDGRPFAAVVNYQAHPTIMMALGAADLSRDWPGQVTDMLEASQPGLTALFFQGSCGDLNFDAKFSPPERCDEPGRAVAGHALQALASARAVEGERVVAVVRPVPLPTRRWTRAEIDHDRTEAEYRLRSGDTKGWLDGFARVIVNQPARLPERYGGDVAQTVRAVCRFGMEWTDEILKDLDTRPETLTTKVQAIRAGDAFLVTNASEFFSGPALDLRRAFGHDDLMIAGYANDSIGYVPDPHDVEKRSYAANQSPKFKNQFPFTAASAPALVQGMLDALTATEK